jgi:hypothetical protein
MLFNIYNSHQPAEMECGDHFFDLICQEVAKQFLVEERPQFVIALEYHLSQGLKEGRRAWQSVYRLIRNVIADEASQHSRLRQTPELLNNGILHAARNRWYRGSDYTKDPFDSVMDNLSLLERFKNDILHSHFNGRVYFLMQDMKLAVGPPFTQTGDEIWILGGANTPVVLRRASTSIDDLYSYIGQAFVYGAMDGESLTAETRAQRRTIFLK